MTGRDGLRRGLGYVLFMRLFTKCLTVPRVVYPLLKIVPELTPMLCANSNLKQNKSNFVELSYGMIRYT